MINEDASEGRPSESRTSLHDPVYKKGRLETEVVKLGRIQIIQYVDDLLLSWEDEVREATIKPLNFLGEKGLRVSKAKLQFVEPEVLLTTEAVIRTKEREWIHASRIKGPVEELKEWTITSEPGETKLTLKRGLGGNELGRPKWSKKHTQDHT
ncbi:hypothetical protein DUI87_27071 [Hirundo rustica rustica]|uniref:Reverse transcriptase domain-containing protein n=1 Tax=Hirundo rustica rustica TaxID=333673 RepID=A0A3M0JNG1_HIRRU|nr:hypothetical protein DUI87_27071 [Hirundo rustica rustica]